jgi:hypothetical protein
MSGEVIQSPKLFVVGLGRSGTTLAQKECLRLAGLGGPPETAFWGPYSRALMDRRRGPMGPEEIREELGLYQAHLGPSAGKNFPVGADQLIESLGGRCDNPVQWFSAITKLWTEAGSRETCERKGIPYKSAEEYVEKTPRHWQLLTPLAKAMPDAKFVWINRDPRGILASMHDIPFSWGRVTPAKHAARWMTALGESERMQHELGDRLLRVTFEDVVRDPRAFRQQVAQLLGRDYKEQNPTSSIYVEVEKGHKGKTDEAPDLSRISAWRSSLSQQETDFMTRVCGRAMQQVDPLYLTGVDVARATPDTPDVLTGAELQEYKEERSLLLDEVRTFGKLDCSRDFGSGAELTRN